MSIDDVTPRLGRGTGQTSTRVLAAEMVSTSVRLIDTEPRTDGRPAQALSSTHASLRHGGQSQRRARPVKGGQDDGPGLLIAVTRLPLMLCLAPLSQPDSDSRTDSNGGGAREMECCAGNAINARDGRGHHMSMYTPESRKTPSLASRFTNALDRHRCCIPGDQQIDGREGEKNPQTARRMCTNKQNSRCSCARTLSTL